MKTKSTRHYQANSDSRGSVIAVYLGLVTIRGSSIAVYLGSMTIRGSSIAVYNAVDCFELVLGSKTSARP